MVRVPRRRPLAAVLCRLLLAIVSWAGLATAADAQLRADPYVSGLSAPVAFIQDPSDAAVQYVVEQGGRIRVVRNGVLLATDFLNLAGSIVSGGEQGLLGLAFPPDYGTSGRFYVNFTTNQAGIAGNTVVARFRRSAGNPLVADPSSRLDLLWSTGQRYIVQDFANHNGGNLAFGPDGYLYIGMGDGGSGNDPNNRAQTPGSLLGKMLRIDVSVPDSDPKGFAVPPDNLFSTKGAAFAPEIWSIGLRNPWRWSFDNVRLGGTGALVIGDVGQGTREEIDYEAPRRRDRNYGWRIREGFVATPGVPATTPAFLPLTDPIFDYGRNDGASTTGGYVYRGAQLGAFFVGRYFFADFVAGHVWSMALTLDANGDATASDRREHTAELSAVVSTGNVSAFGEDANGELYIVSYGSGQILRIVSALGPAAPTVTTGSASNVTRGTATLNASVNPNGSNTTAVFDYGLTTSYGQTVDAIPNPGSGRVPVAVSAAIAGLTCGRTYHFRVRAANGTAVASGADASFAAASCAAADLVSPPPGSTLGASRVSFEWTGGVGVSQYWLYVGTTPGGTDLFNVNRGTNLDATVGGLPADGRTLYARLWSFINSTWVSTDYSFTAATLTTRAADLTSPAPGTTLTGTTVTFEWLGGAGVTQYWIDVGTSQGGAQITSQTAGTGLSATIAGLPSTGVIVWIRLWSLISGTWQFHDYQFMAPAPGVRRAQLLGPAPGSTLSASAVELTWDGGVGASGYWLFVGTSPGGTDLFNADRGTNLSAVVTGLPMDGRTLYARLFTHIGNSWLSNDYAFTSFTQSPTRLAEMSSPAPGSMLRTSAVVFQWTGGDGAFDDNLPFTFPRRSHYWLDVGTTPGGRELYGQARDALDGTVRNLPTDGRTIYVRLWSLMGGTTWQFTDYFYTATTRATALAELTSPAPGTRVTSARVEFRWNGGAGVNQYWLDVGTTPGGRDVFGSAVDDLRVTVANLPESGTLYVRLWSRIGTTWLFYDYQYTAATGTPGTRRPEMISPPPQSALTAQTMRFEWTGGNYLQYWFTVGTGPGGHDIDQGPAGSNLSVTVAGLPRDGRQVYFRLWYFYSGVWFFTDYVFAGRQ